MKISTQTYNLVGEYGIRDAYRMIREAGFEAIDWNIDTALDFDQMLAAEKLEGLCIFERSQEEIDAYFAEELAHFSGRNTVSAAEIDGVIVFTEFKRSCTEYSCDGYGNAEKCL